VFLLLVFFFHLPSFFPIMSYRSFLLLASAGIAVARTIISSCDENLAAVTGLLQADDGKAYCSSILDIGTVTNTIVESTTTQEITTITTQSEVALSTTITETETISSGTVTETLPLFMTTTTLSITTTAYACPVQFFRRDLAAYNEAKTTSSPMPTPGADEWEDEDCEDEDGESEASPAAYDAYSMGSFAVHPVSTPSGYVSSAPAAYGVHSMGNSAIHSEPARTKYGASVPAAHDVHSMGSSAAHPASVPQGHVASPAPYNVHSTASSAIYPASAPTGYAASPSTYGPMSSYITQSTISNQVKYPQASGNASIHYPSGALSSSHSLSAVSSDWHPQVSANSTLPHATGALSSSYSLSTVLIESTTSVVGTYTVSTESTTPVVTPAPTPEPSCETAPTALRSGYLCDTISAACGCLGLASATQDSTTTTTFTEVVYTTQAMLVTTITELTDTISLTVPATTLTLAPTSTETETALVTATTCPCSAPTSFLCGTTPDTCRDLQADVNNCGSCGNTCASGDSCSAGRCTPPPPPPAIPEVPTCAGSRCGAWKPCGDSSNNGCVCAETAEGSGICIAGGRSCSSYQRCTKSSECGSPDEKCATSTCCPYGICITASMACPNAGSAGRMFRRRSWDGESVY
jgi:hypothetical protein